MNIKKWIKAAGIRAVKTFAQAFVACIGTTGMMLSEVKWGVAVSTSCVAAIFSLAMSLAGLPELEEGGEANG